MSTVFVSVYYSRTGGYQGNSFGGDLRDSSVRIQRPIGSGRLSIAFSGEGRGKLSRSTVSMSDESALALAGLLEAAVQGRLAEVQSKL